MPYSKTYSENYNGNDKGFKVRHDVYSFVCVDNYNLMLIVSKIYRCLYLVANKQQCQFIGDASEI